MTTNQDARADISIVIPHYGDPRLTASLIERLEDQHLQRAMQIIVADDCSPVPFPARKGVEVVRLGANRGFGTAVNRGADRATHPLLMVLNSDVEPERDFIERFIDAVGAHMPCIASPNLVEGDRRGTTAAAEFPSAAPQVLNAMMPVGAWRRRWPRQPAEPEGAGTTAWVAGACMLLRTADFKAMAGFDEAFYMYGEDIDICRRLNQAGVPAFHAEDVELVHAHGGSSDPSKVSRWAAASRFRYAEKWGFRRRLGAGVAAASFVNFGYNSIRMAAGRDVRPLERLRYEWSMLRYGWSQTDPRDEQP